jgi:hypothetical protein
MLYIPFGSNTLGWFPHLAVDTQDVGHQSTVEPYLDTQDVRNQSTGELYHLAVDVGHQSTGEPYHLAVDTQGVGYQSTRAPYHLAVQHPERAIPRHPGCEIPVYGRAIPPCCRHPGCGMYRRCEYIIWWGIVQLASFQRQGWGVLSMRFRQQPFKHWDTILSKQMSLLVFPCFLASMFSRQKSKVLPVTGPQNHALRASSFPKHWLQNALSCLGQMLEYTES